MINPNNPYKGRPRPKFTATKGGEQLLRKPSPQPGEKRNGGNKGAVPRGSYDVSNDWLRGRVLNSNFDRSPRKR
jgi:hypothetical protein